MFSPWEAVVPCRGRPGHSLASADVCLRLGLPGRGRFLSRGRRRGRAAVHRGSALSVRSDTDVYAEAGVVARGCESAMSRLTPTARRRRRAREGVIHMKLGEIPSKVGPATTDGIN